MKIAKDILELIEKVDINENDIIKLNENVHFFITGKYPVSIDFQGQITITSKNGVEKTLELDYLDKIPKYCTSRDTLKSIRPVGWWYQGSAYDPRTKKYCFEMANKFKEINGKFEITKNIYSGLLPTEELAELHAIIQAIEYERLNK